MNKYADSTFRLNRAFSGINQGLNYPTASPTPTSVSGQGNSPVRAFSYALMSLGFSEGGFATLSPILIAPGRRMSKPAARPIYHLSLSQYLCIECFVSLFLVSLNYGDFD